MDGLVEDSQFEAVDERQWVFQVVNCTSLETVSDAFPWAMLTDNFPALKSPGLSGKRNWNLQAFIFGIKIGL